MSHPLSVAASNPVVLLPHFPRSATASPLLRRSLFGAPSFPRPPPPFRGTLCVARLGFIPDPEGAEVLVKELFGRAEGLLYTIADAAVSSSPSSSDAVTSAAVAKQNGDWLSGISNYMESVLKVCRIDLLELISADCGLLLLFLLIGID